MNPVTSILVLCISASYGSILPLKFDFGNNKPIDFSVKQCDGHEDDPLVLVSGTMEEELCMPGSTTMNTVTRMREDLPTDLMVQLNLQKITPFPMTVPCLDGVGSCEYDICKILENAGDSLCANFPPSQPCSCPFLEGEIEINGLQVQVDDMGDVLGAVMEGSYEATANFYGASNPDRAIGCIAFSFTLKRC